MKTSPDETLLEEWTAAFGALENDRRHGISVVIPLVGPLDRERVRATLAYLARQVCADLEELASHKASCPC